MSRKVEFNFPLQGKDINSIAEKQPLFTSPYLENVRPQDTFEKRFRGGQRPAVRKWGAGSRVGGGDYRIDKIVKAFRGTQPIDIHTQEQCELLGWVWSASSCHYPEIPGPSTANVWKTVEDNGVLGVVWGYDTGGIDTEGITVDGKKNVYVVGTRTSSKSVWKLNVSGYLVWSFDTLDNTDDIAVDSLGNVYVAGDGIQTGAIPVAKLDSDGNLVWSYDTGTSARGIAVDSSGNVYIAGTRIWDSEEGWKSVWKLNSDGELIWVYDTGVAAHDVVVDSSGNVYVAGAATGSATLWKLNSDGDLQWTYNTGYHSWEIIIDAAEDNIYVASNRATDEDSCVGHIRKLNSDGALQWCYDGNSGYSWGITLDRLDNVYVVGEMVGDISVWKLDSDGNLLWEEGTGDELHGICYQDIGMKIYIAGDRIAV